jgi:hypothetical protein
MLNYDDGVPFAVIAVCPYTEDFYLPTGGPLDPYPDIRDLISASRHRSFVNWPTQISIEIAGWTISSEGSPPSCFPAPRRRRSSLTLSCFHMASRIKALELRRVCVRAFKSTSTPNKMVSLSFFRDERAVQQWRNTTAHRATQARGRAGVFTNYRLRVAEVVRDYGMTDRAEAPADSVAVHSR